MAIGEFPNRKHKEDKYKNFPSLKEKFKKQQEDKGKGYGMYLIEKCCREFQRPQNFSSNQSGRNQLGNSSTDTDWRLSSDVTHCRIFYRNTVSKLFSPEIREQLQCPSLPDIPALLESLLFKNAESEEEYMNLNMDMLKQRVEALLNMDVPSNFDDFGGGSSHFTQQQHANDMVMDMTTHGDLQPPNNIFVQPKLPDFMTLPVVPTEVLEASTYFTQPNEFGAMASLSQFDGGSSYFPQLHANHIDYAVMMDTFEQTYNSGTFPSKGLEPCQISEEPEAQQEKQTKSSNTTTNVVSLTDAFTHDQIKVHIMSLRNQSFQRTSEEEMEIAANPCQLCGIENHYLRVLIYCSHCGIPIKRNAKYFCRNEELDAQSCFCSMCFKNSKSGSITYNGTSVCKTLLEKKKNDEVLEESWVECNKCKRWQHQICALYNNKSDLDSNIEYICLVCRLKEIENRVHVPLPKTAVFGAKDLPRTTLSEHIEKRLFERLTQEADWAKVKANVNLDEVLGAENLFVREVLSVEKKMNVKKQFLDILPKENTYPAEFPYRSRVILLFQHIEGVDVCIFGMYVQEFGPECGYPNQRSVYVSYLDSVKYFRPERKSSNGESLRTVVYHEILVGYLDFCKKRGFTTCYIWSCPPEKGNDYILYCHPDSQKTPKNDKLRDWYLSMLRKAADENIVVGLTNIYDRLFVPTRKWDSKVTTSRLPYFEGDYWSCCAMNLASDIEKESGGDYVKILKKQVTGRALKSMGYTNPSKGTAKDILVMQKLGQKILPRKDDFIVVHLQHPCTHCGEVIVSGKRWFCTECKKFQECERCHTADVHTSKNGEVHKLCQVLVDIPLNTKENDITLHNKLFEDRNNFLSFCQKNHYQFDTLRRAKYSSMMVLYHLKNPTT